MRRKNDKLLPELRDSGEYRVERLEEECDRLTRRLTWAMRRGDAQAVERLSQQLDKIEAEIDADLAPGREPSRFDSCRPR